MAKNSLKMVKKALCLIFAFLLSIESFAAVVTDNDGAAFITKAEFDSLKNDFQEKINRFNKSLDNKIDNAINSYLSNLQSKRLLNAHSLLNKLSVDQRTFTYQHTNNYNFGQNNVRIITNGFWLAAVPQSENNQGTWVGYCIGGLNNYENGHWKQPREKNSAEHPDQNGNRYPRGKFLFLDPLNNSTDYYYITDAYSHYLDLRIYSCGVKVFVTGTTGNWSSAPSWAAEGAITFTNTYNWTGVNNRKVAVRGGTDITVPAAEAICLQVPTADTVTWYQKPSGSTIFTTNVGGLTTTDQYTWTYQWSNMSWGLGGFQCLGGALNGDWNAIYATNTANSGTRIPLTFKGPKITTIAGNRLVLYDASNIANEYVTYFGGLPLCELPRKGNLSISLKPELIGNSVTQFQIAIGLEQFSNCLIENEPASNILFRRQYTTSDIDTNGLISINIPITAFPEIKDKLIWIKAHADNGSNPEIRLSTKSIQHEYTA